MKQIFQPSNMIAGLFLAILLSNTLFAQSGTLSDPDREQRKAKNLAKNGIRVREGICTVPQVAYSLSGSETSTEQQYRKQYSEYDAAGHQLTDSLFYKNGGPLFTIRYTYEGDLLNAYISSFFSGDNVDIDSVCFQYDAEGFRQKMFRYSLEKGSVDTTHFFYNDRGQLAMEIETRHAFALPLDTIYTIYDAEGHKLKTVSQNDSTFYETDKKGRIVKRVSFGEYMEEGLWEESSYRKDRLSTSRNGKGKDELLQKVQYNYYNAKGKKR